MRLTSRVPSGDSINLPSIRPALPAYPLPRPLISKIAAADISLADLAALTGLSTNHFIRAFRAATQRTPYGYLVERRLVRAREALQRGGLSIADIALATGFRNVSTLTNTFKRHHGVTPSAYRARLRDR